MRKIDKNKVYAFIGRTVVFMSIWATAVLGFVWSVENCITIYR